MNTVKFSFRNSVTEFTSLKQEKLQLFLTVLRSGHIEYVLYVNDRIAGSTIVQHSEKGLVQFSLDVISSEAAFLYEEFQKNGYPEFAQVELPQKPGGEK